MPIASMCSTPIGWDTQVKSCRPLLEAYRHTAMLHRNIKVGDVSIKQSMVMTVGRVYHWVLTVVTTPYCACTLPSNFPELSHVVWFSFLPCRGPNLEVRFVQHGITQRLVAVLLYQHLWQSTYSQTDCWVNSYLRACHTKNWASGIRAYSACIDSCPVGCSNQSRQVRSVLWLFIDEF